MAAFDHGPRKRRIVILGAGFNAPLGMPLTTDLLHHVHEVASRKPWRCPDGSQAPHGMADWLVSVLDWYYPLAGIVHESFQSAGLPAQLGLEQFLSFVSATAALGPESEENIDGQGRAFIDCLRSWLGEAIARQERRALRQVPEHYLAFADSLRDDIVLSFNWNTVMEDLWHRAGVPFSYDLRSSLGSGRAALLKLHGSVDWFPLKDNGSELVPLGEDFPGVGRARGDVLDIYTRGGVPCLVMPTYDKTFELLPLGTLWQLPWSWLDGKDALEVIVIGYSVRPDDFHSRAFLYPRLVRGARKGALTVKVVDCAQDASEQDQIRARFEGVRGCRFFFDGFTPSALDFIQQD